MVEILIICYARNVNIMCGADAQIKMRLSRSARAGFSNRYDVKNQGDTANDPLAGWSLRLENSSKHVVGAANLGLVARA
jgi:hypothetical protein